MMCINCRYTWHFCSECPAPPRCPTTLAYLGYGYEGCGFYYVDADLDEEPVRPHLVTVSLVPGQTLPQSVVVTADLIRDELTAYIGDYCDRDFSWVVTETAPLVFSLSFPSAELLRVCTHDNIKCPLKKFLISVKEATAEPDSVPPLTAVWVLVYGLPKGSRLAPRGGKLEHILKAVSEPVGKLLSVDLASLEGDDPARIEVLCPMLADVEGLSLIFYFGKKGGRLTYEVDLEELESPSRVIPPPLPPAPTDDRHDGGEEGSDESLSEDDDVPLVKDSDQQSPARVAEAGSGPPGLPPWPSLEADWHRHHLRW
ncbi:uncharacterized protein [Aegilops tauschii subsp. strangulata]